MSVSVKFNYLGALMCKFCKSQLKDPRIFFCGHSFCLECVEKLAEEGLGRKGIPCPHGRVQETPFIPPELLTRNQFVLDILDDPPIVTPTSISQDSELKTNKNREELRNWNEALEQAVNGFKAELKDRTTDRARTTLQLLEKGCLEALLDQDAEKMRETWEESAVFDPEKADENLNRFNNAVEEALADLDSAFHKIEQLLGRDGFVCHQPESELPDVRPHSNPPSEQDLENMDWERGHCSDEEDAQKTLVAVSTDKDPEKTTPAQPEAICTDGQDAPRTPAKPETIWRNCSLPLTTEQKGSLGGVGRGSRRCSVQPAPGMSSLGHGQDFASQHGITFEFEMWGPEMPVRLPSFRPKLQEMLRDAEAPEVAVQGPTPDKMPNFPTKLKAKGGRGVRPPLFRWSSSYGRPPIWNKKGLK